jgi:hypothetical protein
MRTKKTFYKTKRTTIREMMAWAMKKERLPTPTSRLEKEWQRSLKKITRRWAVGYVRACVGPHFFAGCYVGAENE